MMYHDITCISVETARSYGDAELEIHISVS